MSFEVKDKDLAGRIGKLNLRSGIVETPAFFPVVHPFKQSEDLPIEKVVEAGFRQVITNAYIIKRKLGGSAAKVHEVLGFNGVVMTDSGAYQILVYGGEKVSIDPLEIAEYEEVLEPDIAVIVDIPTPDTATKEEAEASAMETLRRAYLSLDIVRRSSSKITWVLPVQGGVHTDILKWSAEESRKLSEFYGMYAVGSPVKALEKYDFRKVVDMVYTVKSVVPSDKPVHLFGGGHPLLIPIAVALGVDTFDSASYILYAKDERYIYEHGTRKLSSLSYFPCNCPICRKYEPKDLLEMGRNDRVRLIAEHNLNAIARTIREVKEAIKEGRLWELLERYAASHPSARDAFGRVIKYIHWIEKLDSRFRGSGRGIFLTSSTSYYRPELVRHREFLRRYLEKTLLGGDARRLVLIPGDLKDRPFIRSAIYGRVVEFAMRNRMDLEQCIRLVYAPFFDIVPIEISYTYPYSQCEISSAAAGRVAGKMLGAVRDLVGTYRGSVTIFTCRKYVWSRLETVKKAVCRAIDCSKVEFVEVC